MTSSQNNTVEMRNVSFGWNGRNVFENMSLNVPTGKITAIMGMSGSGKTTLLRLIGGQVAPNEGQILVYGQNIPELSRHDLYRVRRNMGMLFQSAGLFSDLSVFENV